MRYRSGGASKRRTARNSFWFTVVARVGTTGLNEDFPDPSKRDPSKPEYYGETGGIKTDGELFLYVNGLASRCPASMTYFTDVITAPPESKSNGCIIRRLLERVD
jgi:hypothetical protein